MNASISVCGIHLDDLMASVRGSAARLQSGRYFRRIEGKVKSLIQSFWRCRRATFVADCRSIEEFQQWRRSKLIEERLRLAIDSSLSVDEQTVYTTVSFLARFLVFCSHNTHNRSKLDATAAALYSSEVKWSQSEIITNLGFCSARLIAARSRLPLANCENGVAIFGGGRMSSGPYRPSWI